jgi:hypothetical protein
MIRPHRYHGIAINKAAKKANSISLVICFKQPVNPFLEKISSSEAIIWALATVAYIHKL